jgi:hypothetical protein
MRENDEEVLITSQLTAAQIREQSDCDCKRKGGIQDKRLYYRSWVIVTTLIYY